MSVPGSVSVSVPTSAHGSPRGGVGSVQSSPMSVHGHFATSMPSNNGKINNKLLHLREQRATTANVMMPTSTSTSNATSRVNHYDTVGVGIDDEERVPLSSVHPQSSAHQSTLFSGSGLSISHATPLRDLVTPKQIKLTPMPEVIEYE